MEWEKLWSAAFQIAFFLDYVLYTGHAMRIIDRICDLTDRTDPDSVVGEIESTLSAVDNLISIGRSDRSILTLRRRLVSLYEHWLTIQSHLPPCTDVAVGIGQGRLVNSQCVESAGRPPVLVNLATLWSSSFT